MFVWELKRIMFNNKLYEIQLVDVMAEEKRVQIPPNTTIFIINSINFFKLMIRKKNVRYKFITIGLHYI